MVAFPTGVLDQVVRHGVPGKLAHTDPDRAQGGGGAVQLLGGIGEGLLEPVVRGLGLLLAGAVARRGSPQQGSTERSASAEPGHVQRRGQHRPRVRGRGWASCQRVTSCGAAARVWVSPYPATPSAIFSREITGCGGAGPRLLGRAERLVDSNDCGQVEYLAFPGLGIRTPRRPARSYRRYTGLAIACR